MIGPIVFKVGKKKHLDFTFLGSPGIPVQGMVPPTLRVVRPIPLNFIKVTSCRCGWRFVKVTITQSVSMGEQRNKVGVRDNIKGRRQNYQRRQTLIQCPVRAISISRDNKKSENVRR